jgi:hypothetical protein
MVAVTLYFEAFDEPGLTPVGLQVHESPDGLDDWVEVLDTSVIGTSPHWVTSYSVTATAFDYWFRLRWQLEQEDSGGPELFTDWSIPVQGTDEDPFPVPNSEQIARMTQAVIQKATRFYMMSQAPLGQWGEMTEYGMATVRPDYNIDELLKGLRRQRWDIDLSTRVTTSDVIRQGLQLDPEIFPEDKLVDVQRAIDSAVSWVTEELAGFVGIA